MFFTVKKKKSLQINKKKIKNRNLSKKVKKKKGSGRKSYKNNFINNLFLIGKLGLGTFLFCKLLDGYIAQKNAARELFFPHDQIEDLQDAHKKLVQCLHNLENYENLVKLRQTEFMNKQGDKSNFIELLERDMKNLNNIIIVLNNNIDASPQSINKIEKIIRGYENVGEHISFPTYKEKKDFNNNINRLKNSYNKLIDTSTYLEKIKEDFKVLTKSNQETFDKTLENLDLEKKLSPYKDKITHLEKKIEEFKNQPDKETKETDSKISKEYDIFEDVRQRLFQNYSIPAPSPSAPASSPSAPAPSVPASSPSSPAPSHGAPAAPAGPDKFRYVQNVKKFPNKCICKRIKAFKPPKGPNIDNILNTTIKHVLTQKKFKGNSLPIDLKDKEIKELDEEIKPTGDDENYLSGIGILIGNLNYAFKHPKNRDLQEDSYEIISNFINSINDNRPHLKIYFIQNFGNDIFENIKKENYYKKKFDPAKNKKDADNFDRLCIGSILILTHYLKDI